MINKTKKIKNKNKTKKGGEKIGQEANACVYVPPLTYTDKLLNNEFKDGISKFTSKETVESEINKYDIINELDPRPLFYISFRDSKFL